jgi:hypothetical protein
VTANWYRAPEVFLLDAGYGTGIDVWSVGVVAAMFLGGYTAWPPSSAKEDLDVLYALLRVYPLQEWTSWGEGLLGYPELLNVVRRCGKMPRATPIGSRLFASRSATPYSEMARLGNLIRVIETALTLNPARRPCAAELLKMLGGRPLRYTAFEYSGPIVPPANLWVREVPALFNWFARRQFNYSSAPFRDAVVRGLELLEVSINAAPELAAQNSTTFGVTVASLSEMLELGKSGLGRANYDFGGVRHMWKKLLRALPAASLAGCNKRLAHLRVARKKLSDAAQRSATILLIRAMASHPTLLVCPKELVNDCCIMAWRTTTAPGGAGGAVSTGGVPYDFTGRSRTSGSEASTAVVGRVVRAAWERTPRSALPWER